MAFSGGKVNAPRAEGVGGGGAAEVSGDVLDAGAGVGAGLSVEAAAGDAEGEGVEVAELTVLVAWALAATHAANVKLITKRKFFIIENVN